MHCRAQQNLVFPQVYRQNRAVEKKEERRERSLLNVVICCKKEKVRNLFGRLLYPRRKFHTSLLQCQEEEIPSKCAGTKKPLWPLYAQCSQRVTWVALENHVQVRRLLARPEAAACGEAGSVRGQSWAARWRRRAAAGGDGSGGELRGTLAARTRGRAHPGCSNAGPGPRLFAPRQAFLKSPDFSFLQHQ